ncbi:serine hydrolase [Devosia sp.]|uniref:serine hydrolase domain-containing protein n=1 Tax=Devosia sp. TaxID=1871048 RepID=UPI001AC48891|nr:serine hydrolase domain-containing protein [Devosia sp.]MBN9335978.1 beta-lactamase family protein [Devosia sp.]
MGARVNAVMDEAVSGNKIVGAEVIVYRHGNLVLRRTAGHFDREAGAPMIENAIYRLASVTKPVVAATALAMIDKGLLSLGDLVSDHLDYFAPRLEDGSLAAITIHHLLTHTAGLAYGYADPTISTGLGPSDKDFRANFSLVAAAPLLFAPGTGWNYSVAIDVLGAVLATVVGGSLQDAVQTHLTGPLGMSETGFFVADRARLAKPYADGTPPTAMADPQSVEGDDGGSVVFSPSRIFSDKAFQSGGAGMAGTAEDIAKFLEALRTGGGAALKPETVALGFSNRIGDLYRKDQGQRFGYFGAVIDDPAAAESPSAAGTVNWGGVYGHSWLVDPANAITIVSMSNTALEGCTGRYPKDLIRAVYADLN